MGRLKKIAWPVEDGNFIYVHQRVIQGVNKSAYIIEQYVENGKLIIKYKSKKGNAHGVMELNDMGAL